MVLFYLFYPLAPALLVHFSFSFLKKSRPPTLAFIYGVSLVFGCAFIVLILLSLRRHSAAIFRSYATLFNVFRGYLVALLLLAIFTFIQAYRKAALQENRAQIKWIFLGLVLGLTPFIFLYQIPRVLGFRPPLTEDAASVAFIFAPLGLALAIFRFRFLDVDIVINRSLVYSLLTVLTAGIYMFSVTVFHDLPVKWLAVGERTISLGGAILAAILFQPARRRIQNLVDRSFFRTSYDYKRAILDFNTAARSVLSQAELVDFLTAHIQSVLPVERLTLISGGLLLGELRSPYPRQNEAEDCVSLLPMFPPGRVHARRESVSTEVGIDFSREAELRARRWEMALPLPFKTTALTGCLFLGKKRSGQRYTAEDIELLQTLVTDLSLNLERFRLQEEVITERAAKEKFDELNRLKTEFVSTVSHELRTPLTSIQGLTELLEAGKVRDGPTRDEIHHTLAAESARLSRLLRNILDFGKIEQRTKVYDFREEDVRLTISELIKVFQPQLEEGGFTVELDLPPRPVLADIDPDAIKQVMVNLIDNAMKYSTRQKRIDVGVVEGPDTVEIRVRDRGIGIPPEEKERIFGDFYRGAGAARIDPKGVGLGLKIVKHIVEAHRGKILVESQPGEGSLFRVILPRSKTP
jgi:signal transduction histidine kinase